MKAVVSGVAALMAVAALATPATAELGKSLHLMGHAAGGDAQTVPGRGNDIDQAVTDLIYQRAVNRISERNYAAALPLLEQSALSGNPLAMREIARLYIHGLGVARDTAAAVQWLTLAARNGDDSAALALGNAYANGTVVAQDAAQARQWLTVANASEDADIRRDARHRLARLQ